MAAELVYLAGRTWLLRHTGGGTAQELAWSAWRLPFIAIYLALFRQFLFTGEPRRALPRHPALLFALAVVIVAVPFDNASRDLTYSVVLAATSPIVGLREELFYRGIVQGFLERALGPVRAILLATAAFTAFHYGAQPFTLPSVMSIAAAGVVLGVIYQRTRNLWLVATLHALMDAIVALVPPLPVNLGLVLLCDVLAIIWALVWWRIDRDAWRPG